MGGAMGAGAGTDLTLRQHRRDEGQLRGRACACCPTWPGNPAFATEEIERQRQQALSTLQVSFEDPGVHRRRGVRSAGLRLPSLRHAAERHAGSRLPAITRDDLVAYHQQLLRAEQRHPGHGRRRHRRGSVRRGAARCSATGRRRAVPPADRSSRRPSRPAASSSSNKPDAVQTEVRVGHLGDPAQAPGLHGVEPGAAASSAAKGPTGCTRCCAPSAA